MRRLKDVINQINSAKIIVLSLAILIAGSIFYVSHCQDKNIKGNLELSKICVNEVCLGDDIARLHKKIGKPDSVIHYKNPIIIDDSARFFYYLNSYFKIVDNRVQTFSIENSRFKGSNPEIQTGERIVAFLKKYDHLQFKSYVPSGENYHVFSTVVNDRETLYSGEYRIIVKNDTIVKFYFWIPY